ncbi:MAG: phosphate ABC transporter substrate-binding protein [Sulfuritalea sp.]|nr:phosphate ABC transporter substrate-binding protein [Sulfuritalea sp.]
MFIADNELSISALLLAACLACSSVYAAEKPPAKGTAPASGKLLISGSSTMAPMMVAVGKRFSTLHPGVQIEVKVTGSGRGIDDVTKGKADIGMASRALADKDSSLYSFAIARDGVGLVVHKNNPVQSLSNRQVLDIYTGKINNWSKVGGQDTPIAPINAKEDIGSVDLFTHYFDLRYADIKARIVVSDNLARVRALVENPNGIAYMSFGTALHEANKGVPIKLLPIDGVAATTKNIRNGNFPLSRPLLLLTRDLPTGLAKDFINFSLSSQITEIVVQHDFVPYLD